MRRKLLAMTGLIALLLAVPSAAGAWTSGSVSVTKTVTGDLAPSDATFTVKLERKSGWHWVQVDGVRVLHAGQSGSWNYLGDGDYRLVETTTGPFTKTWSPSATFTVGYGHRNHDVTLTNDYGNAPRGSVTVTKNVAGALAPSEATFDIELIGPQGSMGVHTVAAGASSTWSNLRYGTYELVELGDGDYTASFDPAATVVVGDETAAVEVLVTNDYGDPEPTGSLTVGKVVSGLAPSGAAFDVSLVRMLDGGQTAVVGTRTVRADEQTTWSGLAYGNYRIVEMTTGSFVVSYSPAGDVAIGDETPEVTVVVTNAYGDVTIQSTTTTVPSTSPTSNAPVAPVSSQVASAEATLAADSELPFTGAGVWITSAIGLAALAMGLSLVRASSKREPRVRGSE